MNDAKLPDWVVEPLRLGLAFGAFRQWALTQFPNQPASGKAMHLIAEAVELWEAPGSVEEMADIAGILSHLAPSLGELAEAMELKLMVNRRRTWLPPDPNGVIRHAPAVQP
ncbi:MAG: DUF550 domain-containing protein [Thermoflexaceae bacterium]|nr:DUF550 domain-containing protein [Thermoflexaceae bacterium]